MTSPRCSSISRVYRVDQVWKGLYEQFAEPTELTSLPAALRHRLAGELPAALTLVTERQSDGGDTLKSVWELAGGARIESVVMLYADRVTVCVSTQAGCAMACSFCATGQAGFTRHLSVGEIVEQVVAAARRPRGMQRRVGNVVFMGMGEPLANESAGVGSGRAAARRRRHLRPPPHRVHGRHRSRHPSARDSAAARQPRGVAARRERRAARRARSDQPPVPPRGADGRVRATTSTRRVGACRSNGH